MFFTVANSISRSKESTAALVLGCVEGQMSVMFAINRGDVGGGGCTKGHSWSYDSHPTCSYTTIAFHIYGSVSAGREKWPFNVLFIGPRSDHSLPMSVTH